MTKGQVPPGRASSIAQIMDAFALVWNERQFHVYPPLDAVAAEVGVCRQPFLTSGQALSLSGRNA